MSTKKTPFTKAHRLKIYKRALDLYKIHNPVPDKDHWMQQTDGMCDAIDEAVSSLEYSYDINRRDNDRNTFPEYYAHKPHQTWLENRSYWFTRYFKRGGHTRRIAILTSLAKDQPYADFMKEWKTRNK